MYQVIKNNNIGKDEPFEAYLIPLGLLRTKTKTISPPKKQGAAKMAPI